MVTESDLQWRSMLKRRDDRIRDRDDRIRELEDEVRELRARECGCGGEHYCSSEIASLWVCRACHYGHYGDCEDERCQSSRLEDRHE